VADGVDGKKPGWFPYDPEPSEEVENLYQQHLDNDKVGLVSWWAVRSRHTTQEQQ